MLREGEREKEESGRVRKKKREGRGGSKSTSSPIITAMMIITKHRLSEDFARI